MKKEKFDYVCSIGASCLCASSLKDAGLRLSSGPLDWVSGSATLLDRVAMIESDFAHCFDAADFQYVGNPNGFDHESWINRRTGITFPHDFDPGVPFADMFGKVQDKYRRRAARFYERIELSGRVLLVWLQDPIRDERRPADAEVEEAVRRLNARFAGHKIELLVLDRASDDGESSTIVRHDGFWRGECAYRRKTTMSDNPRPWDIDTSSIVEMLSFVETVDYRNKGQRDRFDAEIRRLRSERYRAGNWFSYVLVRLQVKIAKLILNRLRRRGISVKRVFEMQIAE